MPRPKKQKVENKMQNGSSSHAWADLPGQIQSAVPKANKAAQDDGQLKAFTTSNAIDAPATFGIKAAGSDSTILVTVTNGKAEIRSGSSKDAVFTLVALPEQWQEFFKETPVAPYQSWWGMYIRCYLYFVREAADKNLRNVRHGTIHSACICVNFGVLTFLQNIKQEGISVEGDQTAMAHWYNALSVKSYGTKTYNR